MFLPCNSTQPCVIDAEAVLHQQIQVLQVLIESEQFCRWVEIEAAVDDDPELLFQSLEYLISAVAALIQVRNIDNDFIKIAVWFFRW